jgi:hypothetical protein
VLPQKQQEASKHKQYGKVPAYIEGYKKEAAEKQAMKQAEQEKALLPPGMRLMPEEERMETLMMLKNSQTEVQNMIERLPFSATSLAA